MKTDLKEPSRTSGCKTRGKGEISRRNRLSVDGNEVESEVMCLESILVPTDFSHESLKAVQYAVAFAEKFGARLIVMHVVEDETSINGMESIPANLLKRHLGEKLVKRLAGLCKKYAPPTMPVSPLVVEGRPYRKIIEAASSMRVDLIIMATHGFTGLKRVMMGSTAEQVVRRAGCPVLVVRDKERDFIDALTQKNERQHYECNTQSLFRNR